MNSALVLDGHLKSALATVRLLGGYGIPVIVGSTSSTALSAHSRFAKGSFVYTDPKIDIQTFIKELKQKIESLGERPVIYPFSDATFQALATHKKEIEDLVLWPTAGFGAIDIAFDKAATYSEAGYLGIDTIRTLLPSNTGDLEKLTSGWDYPLVVKPRQSVSFVSGKGISGTASFVHSKSELLQRFDEINNSTKRPPLVQEFIKGEEYGCELVAKDGTILIAFCHHRVRSISPLGGASVVKESLEDYDLSQHFYDVSLRLVEALVWTGPMMVEFKVDGDSRQPYLMEINGRWWGSLPLSVKAGVDFPWWYYRLATGENLLPVGLIRPSYTITRHFLGDLKNLLSVLFKSDKMRSLLYPTRKMAVRDFLRDSQVAGDIFSWSDPLPALWEYVDLLNKFTKKINKSIRLIGDTIKNR